MRTGARAGTSPRRSRWPRSARGWALPGAELIAATQDPAIKARLKAETDRSLERGVFGSPFFLVDGEPFWGADRLDQVERWLATGGW